ncbi:hypothetical protein [Phycisphaera mikurensis]|uniref:Uncharacterized protein n=1 Tax=Phycisphaera mikurensis (strain NBRC 102666 / KCTC 22515 / FYK2301M01) TaxID=1142394 RepID=I0II73_PHYMF|nr:hypothetical protein [Phycisphaera mikurensis]MBB6442476.1 Tfp pilus assembly protein PilV [Phycisphaera mikurensis]BAM04961.1 hypothetical protein PSMK_28020 [Phycisphaera mikurensis NBRC 102666]
MSPGPPNLRARPDRGRAGVSLVEATLSMLLVAGLMVAALHASAAAAGTRHRSAERALAARLAQDLVAEALALAYDDPEDGPYRPGFAPGWGPTAQEMAAPGRTGFDDVDDVDGWSRSPLLDRQGVEIPRTAGLRRAAWVRHVSAASPGTEAGADEGLKRVVVRVTRGERLLAEAVGLATRRAAGGGG